MAMRAKGKAVAMWTAMMLALSFGLPLAPVFAEAGAEASYARGLIAFDQGSWDAALEHFDRAVAADPENSAALYYRGLTQARRGELEAAIADLEAAIEINPTLDRAVLDLGIASFDHGDYDAAESWLERAYAEGSDRRTAALYLGLAKYRLGDYAEAERYLEEAKSDPELRQAAHYYSAMALSRLGRTGDAQLELASAASVSPETEMGRIASRHATGAGLVSDARVTQPWSFYADTELGYDSNVTIGAADGVGDTGEDGDGAWVLALGGDYSLLDVEEGILRAGAELSQSVHFDRSDFDLTGTRFRLDWTASLTWFDYGIMAGYDFYGLNYQTFYQDALLTPWVGVHMGERAATQFYYGFRYRDFFRAPFSPYRDGFNNSIGVRQFFLLPDDQSVVYFGYRFDAEDPEDRDEDDVIRRLGARDFEYDAHQFEIGIAAVAAVPGLGPLATEAGYLFRYQDYTNPNSRTRSVLQNGTVTDGVRRHDGEHELALTLARDLAPDVAFLQQWTNGTEVTVTFIGVIHKSNVSEFDYDRFLGLVGLRAWF
jgi:tetratricopeptide (TPR) repeat protein